MINEPTIRLYSRDLLSKWGFNDGDYPDEWADYCETHGVHPRPDYPLAEIIRRYLLPALAEHHTIEVDEIITPHNPIQARTVDGAENDPYAIHDQVSLTPAYVDVPLADVLRIAQEGQDR